MTMIKFKNEIPVRNRERMPNWSDLFNDLFDNVVTVPDMKRSTMPAVNIVETEHNYRLEMAAPGLKKEDFKVKVENDILTISTEKKTETSEKDEKYTRKEYSYSSFLRSFTLPDFVEMDQINAGYENGVLTLTLPKKEEAKPKSPREIKIS